MLGLSKQTTRLVIPGKRKVECILFNANDELKTQMSPELKRITTMLVYSDIVELSLVGDTQAPHLGALHIKSKFGDQAYWSFNPPYYVRLREKHISTISI